MLRTTVRVVLIVVLTIFVGITATLMGFYSSDDLSVRFTNAVVMRSLFVMALLLVITRAFRIRDRQAADHAGRPYQMLLVAAGLPYVVSLAAWSGQALYGQLLLPEHGVASASIDFATWMAVAVAGVLLGDRARVKATVAPVPYA